ncbi:MAG: ABC transporter ATP-binding protein [Lachnospiraceae bacterium]|nr:ABC transporter ATP-binding protein [Lachnospiraceae bacterium]
MTNKKPGAYAGYTEARKAANAKYEAETVERISLVLPKGKKAVIKARTEKTGQSVNSFINKAINEKIQRDDLKSGQEVQEDHPEDPATTQPATLPFTEEERAKIDLDLL